MDRFVSNITLRLDSKGRVSIPASFRSVLTRDGFDAAAQEIASWPGYAPTPLHALPGLARALAIDPAILLMDEPFSALDVATRENLQDELIRIRRETGKTILFVTHDIDEAVYLADRIIALGGKPGEVRAAREITLPHPRKRATLALAEIAHPQFRDELRAAAATL